MSSWNDDLVRRVREVLGGNDKVDITVSIVLWYHRVFWIEGGVIEVQYRRVREIQPADCMSELFKVYTMSVVSTRVLLTTKVYPSNPIDCSHALEFHQ